MHQDMLMYKNNRHRVTLLCVQWCPTHNTCLSLMSFFITACPVVFYFLHITQPKLLPGISLSHSLLLSLFLSLCYNVMLMTGHMNSPSFACLYCSVPSALWWMWCCRRAPRQALRPCVWCHSRRESALLSSRVADSSSARPCERALVCVGALFIWGEGALRVSCLALTGSHLSVAVRAAAVSICKRSCTASMCSACWILERLHSHPQAFWRGHRVFSHTDLSLFSLSLVLSLSSLLLPPSLLLSQCQLIKASDQV